MSFTAPKFSFGSRDFGGGFLDTPEPDTLPPSASGDAKNCLLTSVQRAEDIGAPRAVLRKRLGSRLVNPTPIASQKAFDGLWEFLREAAAGELLAVCNGALYKYDNATAFSAISGGTGFTIGNSARFLSFKNNAFVSDGIQNLRYNGSAALPVGFLAPTAAPALAATGTGLTGTYEGFAVWYDSVMDHESSPSGVSTAVALTNQSRQWTKPTGSPPGNVDNWRIYCRRTDTNERNYFRTATVAIGTGSVTEAVSDGARTVIGPNPNDNDVPPAFALMEEWKGFRLGVTPNSSTLYVSSQYDAESQHPNNLFPIGGKGDTKPIRCVKKFGEQCVVQKPRNSYRVIGDRLPFQFVPIKSSLGNVSQEAGLEVRGYFYAWDEIVGPYRTDLNTWQPLADNRIVNVFRNVNRQALDGIKAEHSALYNLILWIVPTTSTRKRTILAYNYVLDRWLPPITGFEYASVAQFTTPAGAQGLYFGDYWGRLYELFSGEIDGLPAGSTADVSAAIAVANATTIATTSSNLYTEGSGANMAGMPIGIRSPSGSWQFVRVSSSNSTSVTLDTVNGPQLNPVPPSDGTWMLYIGPIEWYWFTPPTDHGQLMSRKLGRWLALLGRVSTAAHLLEIGLYLDRSSGQARSYTMGFPTSGLVWGVGKWGVDLWGASGTGGMRKRRMARSYETAQLRFSNYYPNQPFVIGAYQFGADALPSATVSSG
jgi:hypothetical protein